MTKVYLRPDAATIEQNNGIGRVVHAQYKYLPQYDIQLVGSEGEADVIACHAHQQGAHRIDCLMVHGLYWTGDPGSGTYANWHTEMNTDIIASARRARVITVPSEWVAMPFKRDMRVRPVVIGHGVELEEWSPGQNGGYVLWGKNRGGDVCSPVPAWELAKRGVKVVSTFAPDNAARVSSLVVTGALSHKQMKEMIRNAEIYLATTKETFGIQTLEALACGVPVVGYDWGGTSDIVISGVNGLLVTPGDMDGLSLAVEEVRSKRRHFSEGAIASAQRYAWPAVIERYAALYHALSSAPDAHGVAVVVPAYNYGRFLGECLDSILAQTYPVDEIVVVDDGSTDDTLAVARQYETRGVRVIAQSNQGVAAARNNGIAATHSPYIVCIDADDLLAPRYVEVCRTALMRDRGLGITYTGLQWLRPGSRDTSNHWKGGFNWEWQATAQVPPATSIPTGAMFRRAMWERAGGYKQQYAPGEDTEFYTRGLSVGFDAAQITDSPWFLYRDHGTGAHKVRQYGPIDDDKPWMRDKHYPLAAPSDVAPPVRSYSTPRVSVIVPVGPGHEKYVTSVLDSLLGQTMRDWEVVVVNDSVSLLDLPPYPFARMAATAQSGSGAGVARNVGLVLASAPLVLFLDADDTLDPDALKLLCQAYAENEGRYIYGDVREVAGVQSRVVPMAEYDRIAWLDFATVTPKHPITVLMATDDARKVGGFDVVLPWEDWDFFIKCALAGIHGKHIDALTLNVRRLPGSRTEKAYPFAARWLGILRARYGGKTMAKSCCGGNGEAVMAAKLAFRETPEAGGLSIRRTAIGKGSAPRMDGTGGTSVRMQFVGARSGAVTFNGKLNSGRQYRGGNNQINRYANVHPDDVVVLEATTLWRRVGVQLGEPVPVAIETPKPAMSEPETRAAFVADVNAHRVEETAAVAEAVELPTEDTVVDAKPVQTAAGVVKRKRVVKAPKNTPLKDLPES